MVAISDAKIINVLNALKANGIKYNLENLYSNGDPLVAIILRDYTIKGDEVVSITSEVNDAK